MTAIAQRDASGAGAPFRQTAFTVLWGATVVSTIGTWMKDVGAGWLMTGLAPSPQVVARGQAAARLPVFLFANLTGAVADIVDRRRLLRVVDIGLSVLALTVAAVCRPRR